MSKQIISEVYQPPIESLLERLKEMTEEREPVLYADKERYSGSRLYSLLVLNRSGGNKGVTRNERRRMESLRGQVVGERRKDNEECERCIKGAGKFVSCVVMPGRRSCANCHWNSEGCRCIFPGTGTPTSPAPHILWARTRECLSSLVEGNRRRITASRDRKKKHEFAKRKFEERNKEISENERALASEKINNSKRIREADEIIRKESEDILMDVEETKSLERVMERHGI